MGFPLILGCALGAAVIHELKKSSYNDIEHKRNFSSDGLTEARMKKAPSDQYGVYREVTPKPGSIVCCEVYGMLDHTGVWIDENTIVELSNSGLVKAVSANRFLKERSGKNIFVACDNHHQPIVLPKVEQRAIDMVFSYREYDVIENNCHRFVNHCIVGRDEELTRFQSLNKTIANKAQQNIYWDKVKLSYS